MSTRFVTGAIGAAVGFAIAGPQGAYYGWAIGSAAGNVIDPQVIKGPSIGDISQQTSSEGGPIPIIFGMSPPIAGNVIATSEPRIAKKKSSGKGGPKIESEYVYRTYAIGVCEGPIGGFLRVWRNGKKVYDPADPLFNFAVPLPGGFDFDPVLTRNEKFLEKARFFLGTYDQNASPDLEAVFGASTTPSYRGLAYMVMDDEDVTDMRGVIPQWQFQVTDDEVTVPTSAPQLSAPSPFGYIEDSSEVEIAATTTQGSGTFYVVLGTGAELVGVTAAQIIAGQKADGDPAIAADDSTVSDTSPSLSIAALTPETTYRYAAVQVNANGTSNIVKGSFATAAAPPVTTEIFIASGTWNKPPGLVSIEVICIGAGGGGASGSIGAGVSTGTANHQRGGGGGGRARAIIMAGDLPSTVTVTVGVGGTSGAARTGSHASGGTVNGNAGGAGGNSSFGAFVAATGGTGGAPTISGGGGAQTAPGGAPLDYDGVLLQNLTFGGGGGDAGSLASPDDFPGAKGRYGAGGGGAGGAGRHTTPFTIPALAGGKGNDWTLGVGYSGGIDVGGGGAIGTPNGQNGTDASVVGTCGDGGGGGAAGIDPANPGSGGDGGFPGGGGAGGGAKLVPNSTSGTSGAGGAGANGIVIVIPTF
jgi:hypothetical protein